MTAEEFDDEFLLNYQYVGGNSAPGFNAYARSLFLTRAQEELVKDAFSPKSNRKSEGFEQTEDRRRQLSNLVKQFVAEPSYAVPYTLELNLEPNSLIYTIGNNLSILRIVHEHIVIDPNICGKTILPVDPISHDTYNNIKDNPFRRPGLERAWRIDQGVIDNIENSLEIIADIPYLRYVLRYVRRPRPIIVADLTAIGNASYSIEGLTAIRTSELSEAFHPEIITRAVQNALEAVNDPRFQTHILKDQRIE